MTSRVHTIQPAFVWDVRRSAGLLLLIEALLLFAPMAILGSAINWPASLSEPASVVLPAIFAEAGAVRLGYTIYLLYSVLFWPLAYLTARVVAGGGELGPLLRIAVGFAALSTLARCLGIIRWLVVMPALATMYVDPSLGVQTREMITVVYDALNLYGGSIGEVLGVNLFAALWLVLVAVAILRSTALPRWLGLFGLVAAGMLFAAMIEMFGVDIGGLITVTTAGIQLWFLAAGVVLLRSERAAIRR